MSRSEEDGGERGPAVAAAEERLRADAALQRQRVLEQRPHLGRGERRVDGRRPGIGRGAIPCMLRAWILFYSKGGSGMRPKGGMPTENSGGARTAIFFGLGWS